MPFSIATLSFRLVFNEILMISVVPSKQEASMTMDDSKSLVEN